MKLHVKIFMVSLFLSACSPPTEYRWRNLNGGGDFGKDSFECEGIAARTYPAANVTSQYPNPFADNTSRTTCNMIGSFANCQTSGSGQPSTIGLTSDENADDRKNYKNQCLKLKGWQKYEVARTEERYVPFVPTNQIQTQDNRIGVPVRTNNAVAPATPIQPNSIIGNGSKIGNKLTAGQSEALSTQFPEWPAIRSSSGLFFWIVAVKQRDPFPINELIFSEPKLISRVLTAYLEQHKFVEMALNDLRAPEQNKLMLDLMQSKSPDSIGLTAAILATRFFNKHNGVMPRTQLNSLGVHPIAQLWFLTVAIAGDLLDMRSQANHEPEHSLTYYWATTNIASSTLREAFKNYQANRTFPVPLPIAAAPAG